MNIAKPKQYDKRYLTLDTETTTICEKSFVYLAGFYDGENTYIKRTPTDIVKLLYDYVETNYIDKTIVCFVHNLSYDIEFLLPYLRVVFGEEKKSIILNSHKVLSINFDKIEFRCSYLLTGKSLDALSSQYDIEHKKLTGTIDYEKIRFQDEVLEDNVYNYFVNDIVGLHEILKILIKERHGINNLPLYKNGLCEKILL